MTRLFLLLTLLSAPVLQAQELPLGSALPRADAALAAASGGTATLASLAGPRGLVVAFWSNSCPWVDRYEQRVLDLAARYGGQGYGFVLVNPAATDASKNAARVSERGYSMPYLTDEGAQLARALGAQRTPQFFVFDAGRSLVYVGAVDDSPAEASAASRSYLREALDAALRGDAPQTPRTEALGCLIR